VDLLIAVPHHLYHEFAPPVLLPQIPHPIGPQPEGGDDGEAGSIDEGDGGSVVARGRDEGGDGGGETKVAVAAHLGSQEEGDGSAGTMAMTGRMRWRERRSQNLLHASPRNNRTNDPKRRENTLRCGQLEYTKIQLWRPVRDYPVRLRRS
jgi:hypothetical protein